MDTQAQVAMKWLRSILVLVAVVSLGVFVWTTVNYRVYATPSEGSPLTAVTPLPTPTESATSTPIPSPAPVLPPDVPWKFQGATLTVPAIGIDHRPITEYTKANLKTEPVSDGHGGIVNVHDTIVPDGAWTIAWYSSISPKYGKSILSARATNTVYLFGHAYGFGQAIFNGLPNLKLGDTVTVETPTERLTYTMQDKFPVAKIDLKTNKIVTAPVIGRLVMVACAATGEHDANGHAKDNMVTIFQLTHFESLVKNPHPVDPHVVGRLK